MNSTMERARSLQSELVRIRRAIHEQPELGFKEHDTAKLVAKTLAPLGFHVQKNVGKTGVVADIGQGRPCVAIRADMDALPIQELNDVPYCSKVPGVMHACGHDAHVAMALGAGMLLEKQVERGQVRLLFQPSEERTDDEGVSGASRMINDGALDNVDMVIALHVDPSVTTGHIKISPGPIAATDDAFEGVILGHGCHAAFPHEGLDPIFIAGGVISAIHGIVSRHIDPRLPAVVSIGRIVGGTEINIIPEKVTLAGTIRSFEDEVRETLHKELQRAFEFARALGGDYELEINTETIALFNDKRISSLIAEVGRDILGEGFVHPLEPEMGAEDFGYMAKEVPAAMFHLGTGTSTPSALHSPHFDIDEAALPIGTAILAETALRCLKSECS